MEILNFFKELKILIDDFLFFKQPKKYEPNAPSPKAFFENFLLFLFLFLFLFFIFFENFGNLEFLKKNWLMNFFFFFWKIWKSWILSRNWKNLIDDFFFFEKFRNLEFFQVTENFDFFFFFFVWKKPKKYEPNAPSPKAFFEFFFFFFWRFVHYKKKVKKMKMMME